MSCTLKKTRKPPQKSRKDKRSILKFWNKLSSIPLVFPGCSHPLPQLFLLQFCSVSNFLPLHQYGYKEDH